MSIYNMSTLHHDCIITAAMDVYRAAPQKQQPMVNAGMLPCPVTIGVGIGNFSIPCSTGGINPIT